MKYALIGGLLEGQSIGNLCLRQREEQRMEKQRGGKEKEEGGDGNKKGKSEVDVWSVRGREREGGSSKRRKEDRL